jgi:hypothetical protein
MPLDAAPPGIINAPWRILKRRSGVTIDRAGAGVVKPVGFGNASCLKKYFLIG